MSEKDKRQRLQFAQKMKREMLQNVAFWKNEVFFYLDGVSFVHKFHPQNGAASNRARIWRKK